MKYTGYFFFFVLVVCPVLAASVVNEGTITNVIVYRGQALVTRTIELADSDGDVELLVENLPGMILPESLYAVSNDGIQVLSVRYRVKETEKDMRAEVRTLEDKIEAVEKEIYICTRDLQLCNAQNDRFQKMWGLSLDGADVSLDRGAFSSESMKDFTGYLEEKNQKWHEQAVQLELQKTTLEKQLADLNRQKAELDRQHTNVNRQALVYLHIPSTASSNVLQLSYLVNNADWSPQYNLRADADAGRVRIEYNAVVHQSSGEDWTNAALALSTAVPALVASPPELQPMKIGLVRDGVQYGQVSSNQLRQQPMPAQQMQVQIDRNDNNYANQSEQFDRLIQSRRSNIAKGLKANEELNFFATNSQMIEFEADKQMLQELQRQQVVAIERAEGVSVIYNLPGKLTLPSKSDQQLVTIASMDTPAEFVFVAAPLLTDFVYLQAEVTNNSDTILLPGPANMFRSGEFVGKAEMKLVTIGQTFTTGFGVDSQIQVAREFKDKKIESFLGNRIDENYYRLAIDNYYDKPVSLRLMERLPWTENKELAIELTDVSHPLSTDAEYLRTERDKGILRWDLELGPNTTGAKATIINYAFTLKYDNDMAIRTIQ